MSTNNTRAEAMSCPCPKCTKLRLVYALTVEYNWKNITKKDLEVAVLILSTMLSEEIHE